MGCVIIVAVVILGVVLSMMWKIGSFTVVNADVPEDRDKSYYLSRQVRLQKRKLPTRLVVRCNQCRTEWQPEIVADVTNWKDRPSGIDFEEPTTWANYALFTPSVMEVGHAGPQPTEPAFRLACPNSACGYKGHVTLHEIHKVVQKKAKK